MKIANASLPQFSRQALRARKYRLSKCCTDAPIGAPARSLFNARAILGAGIILKKK